MTVYHGGKSRYHMQCYACQSDVGMQSFQKDQPAGISRDKHPSSQATTPLHRDPVWSTGIAFE